MVPKPHASSGAPHVKAEALAAVRILPSVLPKELFRGVPLHTCLAGFGKHWRKSLSEDVSDFAFSEEVEILEDFLSHDWATSRWAKLFALLVIYNSKAASIAAAITIFWAIFGKIIVAPDTPREQYFWQFFAFDIPVLVVFYLFLMFWQRIKNICSKPGMVFLDKLCISQHDVLKKEAGIAGLAGFLLNSRRMVILWSPKNLSFTLACCLHISVLGP